MHPPHPVPPKLPTPLLKVTTKELFKQHREVLIEHDGEYYRLKLTRNNKLILNK